MANNLIPPKLQSSGIVAREIEAHVHRAQLRTYLLNADGYRRDLIGEPVDVALAQQMLAQLANGYDYPFDYNREDFPIRPGARIGVWCYSPWLDVVDPSHASGRFRMPKSPEEFLDHFANLTGVTTDHYELFAYNFGVSPATIADSWIDLTDEQRLFIMSREYQAAVKRWPELNQCGEFSKANKKFGRPLVHAFALLSEIERDALIQADMAILNLLSCIDIRRWLDGDGAGLAAALKTNFPLQRVIEYQVLSSDVINNVLERASQNTTDMPSIDPFANPHRLIANACDEGEKAKLTRTILREAFANPKQGTRPSDAPIRFYGLEGATLGHGFIGDLGKGFRAGGPHTPLKRAKLQYVIMDHVDRFARNQARKRSSSVSDEHDEFEERNVGTHPQTMGEQFAKFSLPEVDALGSAPRASISHWLDTYKDRDLWGYFAGDHQKILRLGLSLSEFGQVISGLAQMRRMLGIPTGIANAKILEICCDLATSVSCISTNRAFIRGIDLLMEFNKIYTPPPNKSSDVLPPPLPPETQTPTGTSILTLASASAPVNIPLVLVPTANTFLKEKKHGSRVIAKVAGFLNHREKIGEPSKGDKQKGTSRNGRRLSKKAKLQRALNAHRTVSVGAQLTLEQVQLILASDD